MALRLSFNPYLLGGGLLVLAWMWALPIPAQQPAVPPAPHPAERAGGQAPEPEEIQNLDQKAQAGDESPAPAEVPYEDQESAAGQPPSDGDRPASILPPSPAPLAEDGSLTNYRYNLRSLYLRRKYNDILPLTDEMERLYPEEQIIAFYRNQSERRLSEQRKKKSKFYTSMSQRPVVLDVHQPIPSPTPVPTPDPSLFAMPSGPEGSVLPPLGAGDSPAAPAPMPRPRSTSALKAIAQSEYASYYLMGAIGGIVILIAILMLIRRRRSAELLDEMDEDASGYENIGGYTYGETSGDETPMVEVPPASEPASSGDVEPSEAPSEEDRYTQIARQLAGQADSVPTELESEAPEEFVLEHATEPDRSGAPPVPDPFATEEISKPIEEPPAITAKDLGMTDLPSIDKTPSPPETPPAAQEPLDFLEETQREQAESTSIGEEGLERMPSPEASDTDPGLTDPETKQAPPAPDEDDLGLADRTKTSAGIREEEEKKEAQVFHPDETVGVNLEEKGEETIGAAGEADESKTKTSPAFSAPTGPDPFEKEHQLGMHAFREARWSDAVHHLSIAAALRPEASEVKEHLRRARRMRREG